MKEVYLPGQAVRAGCDVCQAMRTGTFRYDVLRLEDGTEVPHAMIAFCDVCGSQLAVAQQSAHLIQKARHGKRQKTSVRVPRVVSDLASMLVAAAGGDPSQVPAPELVLKAVLASFLDRPRRRQAFARRLGRLRRDPLLLQPADQKVNLGLTARLQQELAVLQDEAHLSSQSELIRASLVAARQDPHIERELRKLVVLSS